MRLFPSTVRVFCGRIFAAGCFLVLGAYPARAQAPQSEGSSNQPSDYQHPLRTWVQPGTIRKDASFNRPAKPLPPTTTGLMSKLQSIIIPHVEFRKTSLPDAVEYLRQESRRLDPDPDPDQRGVNIFVQLPKSTPAAGTSAGSISSLPPPLSPTSSKPATDGASQVSLSLTMDRLPLLEALKYVATQAGMRMKVEPYAVAIVPADEPNTSLSTSAFRIPPYFVCSPAQLADVHSLPGRIDVRTWLETAAGMTFPPGASANYFPYSHKLFIHNTQPNLDLVEDFPRFEEKAASPTPANP